MRCLVVGLGSIGLRHADVLRSMGCDVAAVTARRDTELPAFDDLGVALATHAPEYVVIANDTGLHGLTLTQLAARGYRGVTLVEKPMLTRADETLMLPAGPVYVGYTLRFHPVLGRLFELAGSERLWSLSAYVGQYLPDWRPGRDYRQSYSSRSEEGGVVRDLSHELDYVQWLAGRWQSTVAHGGHVSALEIASEDVATVLASTERCEHATIHMNYLDRTASRWIVLNGPFGTMRADLVRGTIDVNGTETRLQVDRNQMIRQQHASAMQGDDARCCSVEDGLATVRWVDAIHCSMEGRCWVDGSLSEKDEVKQS